MSPRSVHDLRAPEGDGEILLWPDPGEWRGLLEQNRRRFAEYGFSVYGEPFAACRSRARFQFSTLAPSYRATATGEPAAEPMDTSTPFIVLAHQPELFHPGVWIKNFSARRFADSVGGEALNFVADSDEPRTSKLPIPVQEGDRLAVREVPFAQFLPGAALALQPFLSRDLLKSAARGCCEASPDPERCRALGFWKTAMDRCGQVNPADCLAAARMAAEREFGLTNRELAGRAAPFLPFLFDIAWNVQRFAPAYNAAINAFRKQHRIRGRGRPAPLLEEAAGRIEIPFWGLRTADGQRQRLYVDPKADHPGRAVVLADGAEFDDVECACAPRALALTMFLRLFVADLFIHGLGGAKYDEVTDDIIRRFYGVEPPRYVVATATLRLPLPTFPTTVADLLAVRRQRRELAFSPDRWAARAGVALTAAERALCEERGRLSAEADRLRAHPDEPGVPARRREDHRRLGELAEELVRAHPEWEQQLRERQEQIERELASNKIAQSREWFFALYPPEKLRMLLSKLPDFR
jgi:hypothetical protein